MHWLIEQITSTGFELMIGVFLFVGVVELLVPVSHVPGRHYLFNLTYAVVNTLLVGAIAPTIPLVTRHFVAGLIDFQWIGFGNLLSACLLALSSAIIFDFFYYWLHRSQHTFPVLWQEHLLHHSDAYVNVTTSGRTHIFEQFLFPIFIGIPTAILFKLPPVTIMWISLVPWVWAYVVHANLKLGFGRFWWLLASLQYHRIHHSLEPKHFNRNYSVWFPMWDILFGTAYRPGPNEYPSTGVEGVEVKTIMDAYLLPLRGWYSLVVTGPSKANRSVIQRQ